MNKSRYRLVWNRRLGAVVAAGETQRGVQGKPGQGDAGGGRGAAEIEDVACGIGGIDAVACGAAGICR
jgi:hypothetical protein